MAEPYRPRQVASPTLTAASWDVCTSAPHVGTLCGDCPPHDLQAQPCGRAGSTREPENQTAALSGTIFGKRMYLDPRTGLDVSAGRRLGPQARLAYVTPAHHRHNLQARGPQTMQHRLIPGRLDPGLVTL